MRHRDRRMMECTQAASVCCIFFFNDTATTEIYTLSLHDALPICLGLLAAYLIRFDGTLERHFVEQYATLDRKSTRLNSSHANISYAVFCLKKKTKYKP